MAAPFPQLDPDPLIDAQLRLAGYDQSPFAGVPAPAPPLVEGGQGHDGDDLALAAVLVVGVAVIALCFVCGVVAGVLLWS